MTPPRRLWSVDQSPPSTVAHRGTYLPINSLSRDVPVTLPRCKVQLDPIGTRLLHRRSSRRCHALRRKVCGRIRTVPVAAGLDSYEAIPERSVVLEEMVASLASLGTLG
jgi:hypothetical protein